MNQFNTSRTEYHIVYEKKNQGKHTIDSPDKKEYLKVDPNKKLTISKG